MEIMAREHSNITLYVNHVHNITRHAHIEASTSARGHTCRSMQEDFALEASQNRSLA